MTKDEQNSETSGSDWIDDVVSRALISSYGSNEEPTGKITDQEENSEEDLVVKPIETYEQYPYPDEEGTINIPETPEESDQEKSKKSIKKTIEWLAVIVGALLVAFLIKTFLMQAYYIPSSSMTPALQVGDRVLVNKLSYEFGEVSRGDLVVFKRTDLETGNETYLIKRVIATEGELSLIHI